jgi:hypothetical protein
MGVLQTQMQRATDGPESGVDGTELTAILGLRGSYYG